MALLHAAGVKLCSAFSPLPETSVLPRVCSPHSEWLRHRRARLTPQARFKSLKQLVGQSRSHGQAQSPGMGRAPPLVRETPVTCQRVWTPSRLSYNPVSGLPAVTPHNANQCDRDNSGCAEERTDSGGGRRAGLTGVGDSLGPGDQRVEEPQTSAMKLEEKLIWWRRKVMPLA